MDNIEILWIHQKKLNQLNGMIRGSVGKHKKFQLMSIMDLQNAGIAIDQCHIISKLMANLRWFMLSVHVAETNDTFIYITLVSEISIE